MKEYPKISIVTPSYNQGRFIEQTIQSVIGQFYPNLEYIVIDGGSTDETVEIIRRYEQHITYWVSEKDKGQSHAINKGFAMATGSILAWLNSDDVYMPGTFSFIAENLATADAGILFGNCLHFRENEQDLYARGSNVVYDHLHANLHQLDYIIQPSSFWTKAAWTKVGLLREDLHYGFDWEWFMRAGLEKVFFRSCSRCLSAYRIHAAHKTGAGGRERQEEICSLYKQYSPRTEPVYRQLATEKTDTRRVWFRILIWMLQLAGRGNSYGDIVKMLKPRKYATVKGSEIDDIVRML